MNWSASDAHASAASWPTSCGSAASCGCVIVHDEMNVQTAWNSGFDLIEKLAELPGAMASIALADNPAGCDVESGKQRGDAVTLVVVTTARRLTRSHGQHGFATIQGLDLRRRNQGRLRA